MNFKTNEEKIKKSKKLEEVLKKYKRGLLLDEDVIEIVKVVFKKWD